MDNKEKQKLMVLFAIFGVALILLYYNLLLRPQFLGFISSNKEYFRIKNKVRAGEDILSRKDTIKKNLENLKNQSQRLEKMLPEHDEVPNLLESFSNIAKESNVKIVRIEPIERPAGLEITGSEKAYSEFPILVEAIAGYHQTVLFIKKLENLDRFIKIDSIKMMSRAEDYRNHKLELKLRTYVMQ
ncbi:MAG: type 4a pilus biogenesis protein PilO [Candidatus Omnitrophota bacterium]